MRAQAFIIATVRRKRARAPSSRTYSPRSLAGISTAQWRSAKGKIDLSIDGRICSAKQNVRKIVFSARLMPNSIKFFLFSSYFPRVVKYIAIQTGIEYNLFDGLHVRDQILYGDNPGRCFVKIIIFAPSYKLNREKLKRANV